MDFACRSPLPPLDETQTLASSAVQRALTNVLFMPGHEARDGHAEEENSCRGLDTVGFADLETRVVVRLGAWEAGACGVLREASAGEVRRIRHSRRPQLLDNGPRSVWESACQRAGIGRNRASVTLDSRPFMCIAADHISFDHG